MSYVYRETEGQPTWTVGYYEPEGKWNRESEHSTPKSAAGRVAYLNGASTTQWSGRRTSGDPAGCTWAGIRAQIRRERAVVRERAGSGG